ncbi:hypothetical protein [uncultured Porphyromonas sp.]|uniref:hypothetical protein n=1 Tax=uncultured Porphyromonas sp. TaxID=159274 RepID=UPI00260752C1|nr:hypothetical protein [uncultured Porphyromonas sp.]
MRQPIPPFSTLLSLLTCLLLLVSCGSGEVQIKIDSDKADNTGYKALLYTLQSGGAQIDTLSFTEVGEAFSYSFDRDSIYEAYIVVGAFEQYYPLDFQSRSKVRFHLEVASPHNCYDLDEAKKTGYKAFLKDATPLLRSYDKAVADNDFDNANKEAKLVMQQFIAFASSLKKKEQKRYAGQMDWALEIMSLYEDGLSQFRQALMDGTIDSALFTPEIYQFVVTPSSATQKKYPSLRAINKQDTITWQASSYPQGRILFGADIEWRKVRVPQGSQQSITLLLPLGSIDSLAQIANRLGAYNYIVDAPEPLRVQLYRSLAPDRQAGVMYYSTDSNHSLVVDSTSYFQYNE